MIRQYLLTTRDADRWRELLPTSACVMGGLEHALITERQTGCPARLFVAEAEGVRVAYPFFLRPVAELPFAGRLEKERFDTFTPEYTGPLKFGDGPLGTSGDPEFAELVARLFQEQGVIAEFAHLNPWQAGVELLDAGGVELNREIVYIDLTWGEEAIWNRSFSTDARRHTRVSQREGVRVRLAESPDDVREFHRLYAQTMERRSATERYHFPADYFLAFFDTMPLHARFLLAERQGRAIAGGMFLFDDTTLYWHLSGADREVARLNGVSAYVDEAVRWGVRTGRKRMLLGGSYAANDGVLHFKAGFSPLRAQFRVYKHVHDLEAYEALASAWSAQCGGRPPNAGFFPIYRSASVEPGLAAATFSPG